MTAPDCAPWEAPASLARDRLVSHATAAATWVIEAAHSSGYADGWHAAHREASERIAELDRRILAMTLDLGGESGRVAYLRGEVDRLAPEAAQARTLAAALARAEEDVASLKREVAHLKRLAGLPEGM